jgi:serine/threonine protein kinase
MVRKASGYQSLSSNRKRQTVEFPIGDAAKISPVSALSSFNKSEPMPLTIGRYQPLSKRDFELGPCKGDGKFGRVYLCRNIHNKSTYALKEIPREIIKRNNLERQFTW